VPAQNTKRVDHKVNRKSIAVEETQAEVKPQLTSMESSSQEPFTPSFLPMPEADSIFSVACDLAEQSAILIRSGQRTAVEMAHDYYRIYIMNMEVLHEAVSAHADRIAGVMSKDNPLVSFGQKLAADTVSAYDDLGRNWPASAKSVLELPNAAMALLSTLSDSAISRYQASAALMSEQAKEAMDTFSDRP
jgi:hypothetical protein